MSDTIKITTKALLAALPITGEQLRFVIEEKAWYVADPISVATPDGVNVISSTVSAGRWIKQTASNTSPTNLATIVHPLTDGTLAINTQYIINRTSLTSNLTVSLPSGAVLGSTIKIIQSGSSLFRVVINNNTQFINDLATIHALSSDIGETTFTFIGDDKWITSGNKPYRFQGIQSFTQPASTNLTQNGIFDFLGRNYNLANTWQNPSFSAPLPRKVLFTITIPSSSTSSANVTGKTANASGLSSFHSRSHICIIFYDVATGLPLPVRLSSIYFETNIAGAASGTTTNPLNIHVFGVTDPAPATYPAIMASPLSSGLSQYVDNNAMMANPTRKFVTTISNGSIPWTAGLYNQPLINAKFLPVNSTEYFPIYLFQAANGPTTDASFDIAKVECYGDIII